MNSNPPFARDELLQIARAQRTILGLIALNLILGFTVMGAATYLGLDTPAADSLRWVGQGVGLMVGWISILYIHRLATALHRPGWLYAVAAFFPCINLVTLLVINHQATRTLRANGVPVGLLGARQVDVEQAPPTLPSDSA